MDEVELTIPEPVVDLLPADGENAARDMERAVAGFERHVNATIETADDEAEVAAEVLDVVEHLEARMETYDDFVPELRAWGQSPAYAIAWRDLYADLIRQLTSHEGLADHLEREGNRRLVGDGIRLSDLKE
ncbi:hypothetical protein BRC89_07010 [Halobacteriales archaeon QS_4_70_19]|nr:MAG: hypothetical protein BRC89_07010 [Halobacteriales archaeon QS_4_70_19]